MSPVIRISEDSFKRLQKYAVPLVDTPAMVVDKLLDFCESHGGIELFPPSTGSAPKKGPDSRRSGFTHSKEVDIALEAIHTPKTYGLIPVAKNNRHFFPGYKVPFIIETDIGEIETRVSSAPKGTPLGDPDAGSYIAGKLKPWYRQHSDLRNGSVLTIEQIHGGTRYKLSIKTI